MIEPYRQKTEFTVFVDWDGSDPVIIWNGVIGVDGYILLVKSPDSRPSDIGAELKIGLLLVFAITGNTLNLPSFSTIPELTAIFIIFHSASYPRRLLGMTGSGSWDPTDSIVFSIVWTVFLTISF